MKELPEINGAEEFPLTKEAKEAFAILEKQHKRHRKGYAEFIQHDQPNRDTILKPVRAIMETWFNLGVTYASKGRDPLLGDMARILGIRIYINAPCELRDTLELATGKIRRNILKWHGEPPRRWVHLVILRGAFPKAAQKFLGLSGQRDIKASCGAYLTMPIPFGLVYETEGMLSARDRADYLGDKWYELQSDRIYGYLNTIYSMCSIEGAPRDTYDVESNDEVERKLKASGLNEDKQFQFYCYRERFEYIEIAKALRDIGTNKSEEAVRKCQKVIDRVTEPLGL